MARRKEDIDEEQDSKIDALKRKYADLKDKVVDVERRAEDRIREHPVQSVAIAFGAGALVGAALCAIMRRRRD